MDVFLPPSLSLFSCCLPSYHLLIPWLQQFFDITRPLVHWPCMSSLFFLVIFDSFPLVSTSPCAVCLPPFSQGKWQNQWITKTSVGCYQVKGTVPGSQMDSRMYKTLLFFSPRSWQLWWRDTGEKHENMNVKVIGYVMSHLKRGYFHCLFAHQLFYY